ncbi:MAG: DUF2207 domain-containing protein [Pseudobutyrivibrio sp.]|nr:DUF2207 domain-containing protein [Pseudobutyrivibrio sp.]
MLKLNSKILKRLMPLASLMLVLVAFILEPAAAQAYSDYDDYYIKDMDVNITVNEDNTYDIVETYVYDFVRPHHGPVRKFTLNHTRERADGSSSNVRAHIENLEVESDDAISDIADTEKSSKFETVTIGSADKEYTGECTYTFSYTYCIDTPDPLKNEDELYFNIVGTEWECPIDHVTWTVKMPKDFDTSTIGYSTGSIGYSGYNVDYLKFEVNNLTITGEYLNPLMAGEGITIRATLPDGYFEYKSPYTGVIILIIILGILAAIYSVLKKPKQPVEVVEFYPPNNITPVEAETIYTAKAPSKAISLLPYLANKGYIDIIEEVDRSYSFVLKNDDFSGLTREEQIFLTGMFKKSISGRKVSDKSLENRFYRTIETVKTSLQPVAEDQLETSSKIYMALGWILAVLSYIGLLAIGCYLTGGEVVDNVQIYFIAAVWVFPVLYRFKSTISKKIIMLCVPLALFMFSLLAGCQPLIGLAATVIASVFGMAATTKGQRRGDKIEMYGRVLGFKNFIEKAELDKLQMLCQENPNYYFDILGYAYAFGLSDKWIKQFEALAIPIPQPTWYYGVTPYNPYMFNRSFTSMMRRESTTFTSSPNSGGGGFSGGGSSGGGSGGGGGGAW